VAVPLETLRLPAGFSIALYAEVSGARSMALAPDGTIFVGSQSDTVHAVVDRDQDGRSDEVVVVADSLQVANGVAFKDGSLFVADLNRVLRFDDILDFVIQPAAARSSKPIPAVVLSGLPTDTYHGWRYLAFGPDGLLYLSVGTPCNVCEPGDPYATPAELAASQAASPAYKAGLRSGDTIVEIDGVKIDRLDLPITNRVGPLSRRDLLDLLEGRSLIDLDPNVLAALASLDGAIVVDGQGRLLAAGAILRHPPSSERDSGGVIEGARTTAALAASRFGPVLKVSSDGVITFFDGERVWDI